MVERRRVLLLFSDTGGGHRSAAEAIAEALDQLYPGIYAVDLVDALKSYAPPPLGHMPSAYPKFVRLSHAWGLGFRLSDGHGRALVLTTAAWPYVRNSARRLVRERSPHAVVSVHPVLNAPILKALGPNRPPFLTVVTDLVNTHALWYHRRADLCLVPTPEARERAVARGMRPDQVRVVGLPVSARFSAPRGDRHRLCLDLDWPLDRPVVLILGGAEGMGPLHRTAHAIAALDTPLALAIVAGRNTRLREQLQAEPWPVPVFIYGYERRIPEMMRAATLLVTKAGSGTIAEAMNAGLPIVLCSRLLGQEEGNVDYVVRLGMGVWAPEPGLTAQAVAAYLAEPGRLQRAATACRLHARPDAAREVARIIDNLLTLPHPAARARLGIAAGPSQWA